MDLKGVYCVLIAWYKTEHIWLNFNYQLKFPNGKLSVALYIDTPFEKPIWSH